jgi:hypothetical protein
MNTFSYFIIGILLLSNQALAAKAVAEKIERISVDTFRLTMGEPVQVLNCRCPLQLIQQFLSIPIEWQIDH